MLKNISEKVRRPVYNNKYSMISQVWFELIYCNLENMAKFYPKCKVISKTHTLPHPLISLTHYTGIAMPMKG